MYLNHKLRISVAFKRRVNWKSFEHFFTVLIKLYNKV